MTETREKNRVHSGDLRDFINRNAIVGPEQLRGMVKKSMLVRYLLTLVTLIFLFIFKQKLPFPYPHFLIVCGAFLALNVILHLLSLRGEFSRMIYPALPFFDMSIGPFVFYYTGGFLSPFLLTHLVVTVGSGIMYTNNRHMAKQTGAILLASYLSVAVLQKYGMLSNGVAYACEMMDNTVFFYLVVTLTSLLIVAGVILVEVLKKDLHQTLDDLTGSFDSIIRGTTAVTGSNFFTTLAQCISSTMKVRCVVVAQIGQEQRQLQTLVIWHDDRQGTNYTLPLASTLAGEVIQHPDRTVIAPALISSWPDDPVTTLFPVKFIFGVPLNNSDGKPIGVVLALNDAPVRNLHLISPLISIFAWRASAELDRQLADEKRMQAEHQLAHAQKMEAIGHLASGIAHDFNNIITAIGGYASLLKKRMDASEPSAKYIEHIIDAGKHARTMINQLSIFVKNDKPQVEPVDVHSVISTSISMLPTDIGEGITISTDLKARPSFTPGDTTLLQNIVLNLVINARDACENKAGTVALGTEVMVLDSNTVICRSFSITPGPCIRITISDNGCGMNKEVLDHIFEPFFTTKSRGMGMGLGLTNVWRYIETFKGAVEVRSKPGEGTSFFLYLPLLELPAPSGTPALSGTILQPSMRTILIVDDEPSVREIYTDILTENGYTVYTAVDGREAIEFIDTKAIAIDLVLLDLIMPNMDGSDTFYAIRERFPQMRILLMSGFSDQEKVASLLHEPDTVFFQKPCDDEQLIQHVRSILMSPLSN